ncbi:MAG: ParB/Srx family N-terminal domain-containing protein [Bacteroidota bacterium]
MIFTTPPPVILAEIAPGRWNLIDGNHRMEKARRLGLETLQAYKVAPDIHIRFLTTREGYLAYVEYWNGKMAESEQDGIL